VAALQASVAAVEEEGAALWVQLLFFFFITLKPRVE